MVPSFQQAQGERSAMSCPAEPVSHVRRHSGDMLHVLSSLFRHCHWSQNCLVAPVASWSWVSTKSHEIGHLLRFRRRAGFCGAQQPRGRSQALHELLAEGVQADDPSEPDGHLAACSRNSVFGGVPQWGHDNGFDSEVQDLGSGLRAKSMLKVMGLAPMIRVSGEHAAGRQQPGGQKPGEPGSPGARGAPPPRLQRRPGPAAGPGPGCRLPPVQRAGEKITAAKTSERVEIDMGPVTQRRCTWRRYLTGIQDCVDTDSSCLRFESLAASVSLCILWLKHWTHTYLVWT